MTGSWFARNWMHAGFVAGHLLGLGLAVVVHVGVVVVVARRARMLAA